jgi:hypothetical protein
MLIAFCVFIFLLFCAGVWGLRQPAVRISHIEISNGDQSLATIATETMQGNYLGIIPRDSIFFFPASSIRADILAAHPEFAAISISRNGMTGLSITAETRVPIARWCGAQRSDLNATSSRSDLGAQEDCYLFDANGFIFATSSEDSPVNSFLIFGTLANLNNPIGSTLSSANELPAAFNFARQLSSFGSSVSSIVFRSDEVDDYLASGTRITYVLGDEQNAFTALSSAQNDYNLTDGSIEYIDLRFDGKMYVKKKND